MLFHWPVSNCFSEHTSRPSHTTQPRCTFGCTSRKILNTTDICLTAARGQMRAEFMRTRGSRALPTWAACRKRPAALPGELVCGRLKLYSDTLSTPWSRPGHVPTWCFNPAIQDRESSTSRQQLPPCDVICAALQSARATHLAHVPTTSAPSRPVWVCYWSWNRHGNSACAWCERTCQQAWLPGVHFQYRCPGCVRSHSTQRDLFQTRRSATWPRLATPLPLVQFDVRDGPPQWLTR